MGWDSIIVHCSGPEWGTRDGIDTFHRGKGWSEIGYHFVIENGYAGHGADYFADGDGRVVDGRSLEKAGAHAVGWNQRAVGICLVGRSEFSEKQFRALVGLVSELKVSVDRVLGHYEVNPEKTCPNFDLGLFRLRRLTCPQ